jgi:predicted nucleic acid-binding protein
MNNTSKFVVFLDTSVLLKAFVGYRQHHELPLFINDQETKRFTFEKCVYEAYMAFRGVGGKKPSEGRGDWANRFLKNESDPQSLDKLASRFHDDNIGYALFWSNNILGITPSSYAEMVARYVNPNEIEKAQQNIDELSALKKQRSLFESLCNDFREMLRENNIVVLPYTLIFGDDISWMKNYGIKSGNRADPFVIDVFVRETIIPSEDLENIFAAARISADIFVTDDNHLIKCALSLGSNSSLSPASFCRSDEYESKKQERKSGLAFAKF